MVIKGDTRSLDNGSYNISGLGCRVQDLGFRVWGLEGLGFGGLGFRVDYSLNSLKAVIRRMLGFRL